MHQVLRKLVATMVAAVTVATPSRALAEEMGPKCTTYDQVESNATGGDYVGGLLVYETMGSVSRTTAGNSSTSTVSTSTQVGVPGTSATGTATTSTTSTAPSQTVTTEEPFGFYAMNDGSIYQINCLTGEATQVYKPKS